MFPSGKAPIPPSDTSSASKRLALSPADGTSKATSSSTTPAVPSGFLKASSAGLRASTMDPALENPEKSSGGTARKRRAASQAPSHSNMETSDPEAKCVSCAICNSNTHPTRVYPVCLECITDAADSQSGSASESDASDMQQGEDDSDGYGLH